jgi:hypothetical protein
MVQVQVDLSDDENQIVEVYKAINKLETKEDAIKEMIMKHKKEVWKNVCSTNKHRSKRGGAVDK